jgi:NAD-dependent deacetylase
MQAHEQLAGALRRAGDGLVLVVTGAGISHASGIPTFRGNDPEAVWKANDMAMATFEFFQRDPVAQWEWYLKRFRAVDGAEPNAAHDALVDLEKLQAEHGGALRIVTQNIDTLHERAGSIDLIKVHGSSDRLRCVRPGCENGAPRGSLPRAEIELAPFVDEPSMATLPRCPICDELLRAHVLFFDEYYQEHVDYRFDDVQRSAGSARLMIFIGTSFSVGVTDLIVQSGRARGVPTYSIDPHAAPLPAWLDVVQLREPAEELLPLAVEALAST